MMHKRSPLALDARQVARALGGRAYGNRVSAPGPGHSRRDKSLTVFVDPKEPDGFTVHSHAGDDWQMCRDYVRERLGLPKWQPSTAPQAASERVIPFPRAEAQHGEKPTPFDDTWLRRDGYACTAEYAYTVDGELLYQLLRYEHPSKPKEVRPRHRGADGRWYWKCGTERRPLYRRDYLARRTPGPVFATEGEKDADRVAALGLRAVTAAFGTWTEEAVQDLEGEDCLILEDNDEAGRKKAQDLAALLHGVARSTRIVRLPGLPEKGDVSDYLDAGHDREQLLEVALAAPLWISDADEPSPAADPEPGSEHSAEDPALRQVAKDQDGTIRDAETGEILTPTNEGPGDVLNSLSLGHDVGWTYPTGLLGEMADWILASSRRPNRPLAVAAAVAVLSGVCGRHLYGPTGTALNLYIVMLADTAVGKNRPLSAVGEILDAAGLGILHATAKGFSASAIEQMMADHPCCVATADEIGANLLGRMSHKNGNPHEHAMRGVFLELWSREQGQSAFQLTRRAKAAEVKDKAVQAIPSPSLTLFGASTTEAFYSAVTVGSVRDGFLNRFLLVEAAPRAKAQEAPASARVVPDHIGQALWDIIPEGEGNLQTKLGNYQLMIKPCEDRLDWQSEAVRQRALDFEEEILALGDANKDCAPLMGRIFEYSVRLASLHAVSREGRAAKVTLSDLEWGAAWAVSSARVLLNGATRNMAGSDYEAKFNAVRNTIQAAGMLTRLELARKIRNVSARERDDIIRHLLDGNWIEEIVVPSPGRHAHGWRWIG
ncbi:toprim domain-containing protein [Methylobacterium nigriterrae]|uniref:toprim domain-containing protein n=1 Tax=Methylobacterium nigriterrae TaxID=3127512 RepID=UPI003013D30C